MPSRHFGEKEIHAESCRVGHAATKTARAKSATLTRKTDDATVPALFASDAKKAVREDAATKVGLEFVEHEGG